MIYVLNEENFIYRLIIFKRCHFLSKYEFVLKDEFFLSNKFLLNNKSFLSDKSVQGLNSVKYKKEPGFKVAQLRRHCYKR